MEKSKYNPKVGHVNQIYERANSGSTFVTSLHEPMKDYMSRNVLGLRLPCAWLRSIEWRIPPPLSDCA